MAPSSLEFIEFLQDQSNKSCLRFMTCGSVDDGKSTLIGHLLVASDNVPLDQLSQISTDPENINDIDYSLLLDGLVAEREQGITIDVSYRYFSTQKRNYIVADAPGHEQYTKNMVIAASNSDLALILIDATKGPTIQSKRHLFILSMLGIKSIIVALNKMDLCDYSQIQFDDICDRISKFSKNLSFTSVEFIPVSAKMGDNIVMKSENTPFYQGKTLFNILEDYSPQDMNLSSSKFLAVQAVNRINANNRAYCGNMGSGQFEIGDEIKILPHKNTAHIEQILVSGRESKSAQMGDAVSIFLDRDIDCSPGDIIANPDNGLITCQTFEASVFWISNEEMRPNRQILIKLGTKTASAFLSVPSHKLDFDELEFKPADDCKINDVARLRINTVEPIVCDQYSRNHELGAFILIDKYSNETLAAGIIESAVDENRNIFKQKTLITKDDRALQKHQKPMVVWLTGLSGAGKSTIANAVENELFKSGYHSYLLDGDNIRGGLCRDLGFDDASRVENIRRVSEVAKLMCDAGLIVIVSFISPFIADREMAKSLLCEFEFLEVYIDVPIETAIARDPKGLYKLAKSGKIKNFTGISSPYEPPSNPNLHIDTSVSSIGISAKTLVNSIIKFQNAK